MAATTQARIPGDPGAEAPLTEEAIVASVRTRIASAILWFGTLLGAPIIVVQAYRISMNGSRPFAAPMAALFFVSGLLLVRRSRDQPGPLGLALGLATIVAVPFVNVFAIGPGIGPGTGLASMAIVAGLAFGPRAALAAWLGIAATFLAIAVLQDDGERVGLAGFWQGPRWLVFSNMAGALTWTGIGLGAAAATHSGLAAATAGLREALEHARAERESRIALERAHAANARLEAVGRLSAGVIHDTRNTLAVFTSGLNLLEKRLTSDEDRLIHADLRRCVEDAFETMSQLLVFSGEASVRPLAIEVGPELERFTRAISRLAPAGVDIRVTGTAAGRVHVTPGLLHQALLNLCLNAFDALPSGGEVQLSVAPVVLDGRDWLALEVADGGPGLDPAIAGRVFETFSTTKADGTGLGLARVRAFAEEAGGRATVESEPGRGTRFRLLLPKLAD